ncbi:MAG: SH3 domain-containing protein [Azonexus sp.]|nr:SH3 domain-containing protein [Azonexus sp.]
MSHPISPFRATLGLLCALLVSASCLADSPGTLIRSSELKSQPFIDADALASLPESTSLTVLGTQGGWIQVKTVDGKAGWVRLLNVRIGKPEEPATIKKTISQIGGVVRTGTTKSAATTGVKGLSKEDIRDSKPNPMEIRRLEAFKAKPADVEKFATSRKLTVQEVQELKP